MAYPRLERGWVVPERVSMGRRSRTVVVASSSCGPRPQLARCGIPLHGKEEPINMSVNTVTAAELFVAAQGGDMEGIRALLPSWGAPAEDGPPAAPGGLTPLMAAAAGGHEEVVELLLQCGADPAL